MYEFSRIQNVQKGQICAESRIVFARGQNRGEASEGEEKGPAEGEEGEREFLVHFLRLGRLSLVKSDRVREEAYRLGR